MLHLDPQKVQHLRCTLKSALHFLLRYLVSTSWLVRGEAITTRPLLLHGIARRTRHGHQTTVTAELFASRKCNTASRVYLGVPKYIA